MAFDQTAKPAKGEQIVVMKTDLGTIKLRLFPNLAPTAVENFKGLKEQNSISADEIYRLSLTLKDASLLNDGMMRAAREYRTESDGRS